MLLSVPPQAKLQEEEITLMLDLINSDPRLTALVHGGGKGRGTGGGQQQQQYRPPGGSAGGQLAVPDLDLDLDAAHPDHDLELDPHHGDDVNDTAGATAATAAGRSTWASPSSPPPLPVLEAQRTLQPQPPIPAAAHHHTLQPPIPATAHHHTLQPPPHQSAPSHLFHPHQSHHSPGMHMAVLPATATLTTDDDPGDLVAGAAGVPYNTLTVDATTALPNDSPPPAHQRQQAGSVAGQGGSSGKARQHEAGVAATNATAAVFPATAVAQARVRPGSSGGARVAGGSGALAAGRVGGSGRPRRASAVALVALVGAGKAHSHSHSPQPRAAAAAGARSTTPPSGGPGSRPGSGSRPRAGLPQGHGSRSGSGSSPDPALSRILRLDPASSPLAPPPLRSGVGPRAAYPRQAPPPAQAAAAAASRVHAQDPGSRSAQRTLDPGSSPTQHSRSGPQPHPATDAALAVPPSHASFSVSLTTLAKRDLLASPPSPSPADGSGGSSSEQVPQHASLGRGIQQALSNARRVHPAAAGAGAGPPPSRAPPPRWPPEDLEDDVMRMASPLKLDAGQGAKATPGLRLSLLRGDGGQRQQEQQLQQGQQQEQRRHEQLQQEQQLQQQEQRRHEQQQHEQRQQQQQLLQQQYGMVVETVSYSPIKQPTKQPGPGPGPGSHRPGTGSASGTGSHGPVPGSAPVPGPPGTGTGPGSHGSRGPPAATATASTPTRVASATLPATPTYHLLQPSPSSAVYLKSQLLQPQLQPQSVSSNPPGIQTQPQPQQLPQAQLQPQLRQAFSSSVTQLQPQLQLQQQLQASPSSMLQPQQASPNATLQPTQASPNSALQVRMEQAQLTIASLNNILSKYRGGGAGGGPAGKEAAAGLSTPTPNTPPGAHHSQAQLPPGYSQHYFNPLSVPAPTSPTPTTEEAHTRARVASSTSPTDPGVPLLLAPRMHTGDWRTFAGVTTSLAASPRAASGPGGGVDERGSGGDERPNMDRQLLQEDPAYRRQQLLQQHQQQRVLLGRSASSSAPSSGGGSLVQPGGRGQEAGGAADPQHPTQHLPVQQQRQQGQGQPSATVGVGLAGSGAPTLPLGQPPARPPSPGTLIKPLSLHEVLRRPTI